MKNDKDIKPLVPGTINTKLDKRALELSIESKKKALDDKSIIRKK